MLVCFGLSFCRTLARGGRLALQDASAGTEGDVADTGEEEDGFEIGFFDGETDVDPDFRDPEPLERPRSADKQPIETVKVEQASESHENTQDATLISNAELGVELHD